MPVDSPHSQYTAWSADWKKIRDVLGGERAIKAGRQEYLPKLADQTPEEYEAYLERGVFFDATSRTQDGLLGAIFRKPPDVEVPTKAEDLLTNIDGAGAPFETFAKQVTAEVIALGRYGVLVDLPQADTRVPFVIGYPAESIISWQTEVMDGQWRLRMLVLREILHEPKDDDPFEMEEVTDYRVLSVGPTIAQNKDVPDGVYNVVVFRKTVTDGGVETFASTEPIIPQRKALPLDFIPFQFFGPNVLTAMIQKPPLLGLVEANLGHWHTTVDWKHGAHFTALPTYWVAGDFDKSFDLTIGPATGMKLPEGSQAGILEYKGDGLGSLERMREAEKKDMAVLGARLLEDPKSAAESGVAMGMRHRGENSMLASISDTVGRGLQKVVHWIVWWAGDENPEVRVALNKDFFEAPLTPEGVAQLVTSWQTGGIGGETLFWNLKQGERLPPDMDLEAWQTDLEENGPAAAFLGPDEDEEEDEE